VEAVPHLDDDLGLRQAIGKGDEAVGRLRRQLAAMWQSSQLGQRRSALDPSDVSDLIDAYLALRRRE
jgi:hypothetical protein